MSLYPTSQIRAELQVLSGTEEYFHIRYSPEHLEIHIPRSYLQFLGPLLDRAPPSLRRLDFESHPFFSEYAPDNLKTSLESVWHSFLRLVHSPNIQEIGSYDRFGMIAGLASSSKPGDLAHIHTIHLLWEGYKGVDDDEIESMADSGYPWTTPIRIPGLYVEEPQLIQNLQAFPLLESIGVPVRTLYPEEEGDGEEEGEEDDFGDLSSQTEPLTPDELTLEELIFLQEMEKEIHRTHPNTVVLPLLRRYVEI